MSAPIVKNAADEAQVKDAGIRAKLIGDRELNDLRAVLRMPEGRRVLWRLLSHCRVNATVWEPSARIHYNSGQQDVGHYVMAQIVAADEEALFLMMREAKGKN